MLKGKNEIRIRFWGLRVWFWIDGIYEKKSINKHRGRWIWTDRIRSPPQPHVFFPGLQTISRQLSISHMPLSERISAVFSGFIEDKLWRRDRDVENWLDQVRQIETWTINFGRKILLLFQYSRFWAKKIGFQEIPPDEDLRKFQLDRTILE